MSKKPLPQIQQEFKTRRAAQRQVLSFLTEHGPTDWEVLHGSFDDHQPAKMGVVLLDMKKFKLIECNSQKAVSLTLLRAEYLKHGR